MNSGSDVMAWRLLLADSRHPTFELTRRTSSPTGLRKAGSRLGTPRPELNAPEFKTQ